VIVALLAAIAAATAPQPPVVVLAFGDGADGSANQRRLARRIVADDPDRVLYLGDVYETGTADEFERNFRRPYRKLLKRMLPTPGNHEWANRATGYNPFWRRVTGERTRPWYAERLGSWQVLSLNSEALGSAQSRWLGRALERDAPCRLAISHRPRFSASIHGDQADLQPTWAALRGKVAVWLAGHDHNLQRFRAIRGTVQLVAGSGGRERYPVDERDDRLAFSDDRHFGAYRLTLYDDRVTVVAIGVGGRELDRTTISC
jgi:hypothetical protein